MKAKGYKYRRQEAEAYEMEADRRHRAEVNRRAQEFVDGGLWAWTPSWRTSKWKAGQRAPALNPFGSYVNWFAKPFAEMTEKERDKYLAGQCSRWKAGGHPGLTVEDVEPVPVPLLGATGHQAAA